MACYAPVRSACVTSIMWVIMGNVADTLTFLTLPIHVVVCNIYFGRIMGVMKGVTVSWDSFGVAEEGNERHVTPQ